MTALPAAIATLRPRLEAGAATLGLSLGGAQCDALLAYLALLLRWNRAYNLTAIREPEAMLTQHVLDSLAIVKPIDDWLAARGADSALRLLDVGSGAGLPGVVLAIVRPAWQVVCVDAVAKKAGFVRQVAAELGLPKLRAEHARDETLRIPAFDLITSRAFASLADFATLTRQHLAPGGVWLAMKGEPSADELEALPDGVRLRAVQPLQVPGLAARRCAVWLELAENSAAPPDHPLR